jgi:hypothetical protein
MPSEPNQAGYSPRTEPEYDYFLPPAKKSHMRTVVVGAAAVAVAAIVAGVLVSVLSGQAKKAPSRRSTSDGSLILPASGGTTVQMTGANADTLIATVKARNVVPGGVDVSKMLVGVYGGAPNGIPEFVFVGGATADLTPEARSPDALIHQFLGDVSTEDVESGPVGSAKCSTNTLRGCAWVDSKTFGEIIFTDVSIVDSRGTITRFRTYAER